MDEVNLILDQLPPSDDVTVFVGPEMIVQSAPSDQIPLITQETLDEIPSNSTIVEILDSLTDQIDLNETKIIPVIDQSNFLLTDMLQSKDIEVNPVQIEPIVEPVKPVMVEQIAPVEEIDASPIIEQINQNKPALILLPSNFTPEDVVQTLKVWKNLRYFGKNLCLVISSFYALKLK